MIDLRSLDDLESHIKSLLESISEIEAIYDYIPMMDHLYFERTHVCFEISNTAFSDSEFDGAFRMRSLIDFLIVVRDGTKSDVRRIGNEILKAFESNPNPNLYNSWTPLNFRLEHVFVDEKHRAVGYLTVAVDQTLFPVEYVQGG